MIDIHTHVLPRFDDGAKNTDTAVAMLQAETQQGVDKVVLTPHYYGRRFSPARFLEQRREAFERLKPRIPEGVEVRMGTEVHFTGVNLPPYEELCLLAIEGTKYILIEFPFTTAWTSSLTERLADFINETGYTPIIAHVERYAEVMQNPALVNELIEMGCLIQVNTHSFLDRRTKGLARALLKKGLVHCIGTDAHDMEGRAPNMAAAREMLKKAGYSTEWERTQRIMQAVLEGEQVCVHAEKQVKKFLGKYF